MSDPLADQRAVIVGGAGAVGTLLAGMLHGGGAAVTLVDLAQPSSPPSGRLSRSLTGDVTRLGPELVAELHVADVVVLAVPERVALAAMPRVAGELRPGALIVDTLSVKTRIAELAKAAAKGMEVLGINPMFAPELGFSGRPVAAVVVNDGTRVRALLQLIRAQGARIIELSAEQHDRVTAATQALTHAAVLASGLALADVGVEIGQLSALASPPHATLLALLARILSGSPDTYWDIQVANPFAAPARAALAAGLRDLASQLDADDQVGFLDGLVKLRAFLGDRLAAYRELCAQIFDHTQFEQEGRAS